MVEYDRTIAKEDHMMIGNLNSYFKTTESGLACILYGLSKIGKKPHDISAVLDFGCGYGRIYRALAVAFPNAILTACDLMEPAAQFCAETFGGDWVKSSEDFNFDLPRLYDLVWLGSVFTHLPEEKWGELLKFLSRFTSSNGVIIASVHGSSALSVIEKNTLSRNPNMIDAEIFENIKCDLPKAGFKFVSVKPAVHSHLVKKGIKVTEGEYGFSFVTENWVRKYIECNDEWELIDYALGGWGNNHDVIALKKKGNF